ncbi:MAG: winged helix-turn-helix domain-containing protein [Terriglobia bacterium]
MAKANPLPVNERQAAAAARRPAVHSARAALTDLDRLVHEQIRLGILSALAVNASLSFSDLKKILKTTDGNLSVHARKLEEAGYVKCRKFFNGRLPQTEFELTLTGRGALEHYLDQMEALIQATRAR